ncbi:MAG: hypothetical protein HOJ67_13235 [Rhodospirillaceae bacterium]|nr:hypothetical protein [Rhodospirillaceae bacterium]
MVGRIFLVLVLIAGGAAAYVYAPRYLTPQTTKTVTIWLEEVLTPKPSAEEKVAVVAQPPVASPVPEPIPVEPEQKPEPPEPPEPDPAPAVVEPEPPAPKEMPTEIVKVKAPTTPPIPVNSFSGDLVTSMEGWELETIASGNVDEILIDGTNDGSGSHKLGTRPLTNNDVLKIKGWAGNTALGMRMHHVLISMCQKVIAHAPVMDRRPDIAEKVHPNLVLSGWTAWVAAAHLPRCETPEIRFWAAGAFAPVLSPVNGWRRMDLPSADIEPEKTFYTDGVPLMPENLPQPISVVLNISGGKANLHHCADLNCRVIGSRTMGRHLAFIADRAQDWALVQFRDTSGWPAQSSFKVEKE